MIRITTDSTCDLPKEVLEKYGIHSLPLIVTLGEEDFLDDGEQVTQEKIFSFVRETKQLPKTAARSCEDFREFFEQFTKNGDIVIHCGISSQLSSCFQNALIAKNDIEDGKVFIVDSKALSTGSALTCIAGAKAVKEGKSLEEVLAIMEKYADDVQASFVVDTLDYLYKGGRVSRFSFAIGGLLKIKPKLELVDGKIINTGKDMGPLKVVLKKYIDFLLSKYEPIDDIAFITHSIQDSALLNEMVEYVKSKNVFKEIICAPAGSVISSHCGPGTLGLLYTKKK